MWSVSLSFLWFSNKQNIFEYANSKCECATLPSLWSTKVVATSFWTFQAEFYNCDHNWKTNTNFFFLQLSVRDHMPCNVLYVMWLHFCTLILSIHWLPIVLVHMVPINNGFSNNDSSFVLMVKYNVMKLKNMNRNLNTKALIKAIFIN